MRDAGAEGATHRDAVFWDLVNVHLGVREREVGGERAPCLKLRFPAPVSKHQVGLVVRRSLDAG